MTIFLFAVLQLNKSLQTQFLITAQIHQTKTVWRTRQLWLASVAPTLFMLALLQKALLPATCSHTYAIIALLTAWASLQSDTDRSKEVLWLKIPCYFWLKKSEHPATLSPPKDTVNYGLRHSIFSSLWEY